MNALGESGIEAGAGIIKGLVLTLLCTQSFSSVLLLLMQLEKMIDGYSTVGSRKTISAPESMCVSVCERIVELVLSG